MEVTCTLCLLPRVLLPQVALELWVGFVTQSPTCTISLQSLDSTHHGGSTTRSDFNLAQTFRGQKCCSSDTPGSRGAVH